MLRCTDVTIRGRCQESTLSNTTEDGQPALCYYHKKLRAGMLDSSAAIVIEDID